MPNSENAPQNQNMQKASHPKQRLRAASMIPKKSPTEAEKKSKKLVRFQENAGAHGVQHQASERAARPHSFIISKLLLGDTLKNSHYKASRTAAVSSRLKHSSHSTPSPSRLLHRIPARALGLFLFSFGLGLLFIYIFGERIFNTPPQPIGNFISAVVGLVAGVALIPFGESVSELFFDSHLLNFLFCDLLLMKRPRMILPSFSTAPAFFCGLASVVLGLSLSFCSLLVSGAMLWGILFLATFICCTLASPEFCLVLTALIVPFLSFADHPTLITAALSGLILLSFLYKVMRGKRILVFNLPDFLVLALALLYLLGGFNAVSASFYKGEGIVFALLILIYFPAANLLRNRRTLYHTVVALLISNVAVSVYGIYQHFKGNLFADTLDKGALSFIDGRIPSFFEEGPNVLAIYLTLLLPFCLFLLTSAKQLVSRLFALLPLALTGLALIYTWTRGAWLGAGVALLLFIILALCKHPTLLLGVSALLPFGMLFLPPSIYQRLISIGNFTDSSITYRLSTWRGANRLFQDFALTGVGVGTESFKDAYVPYALPGTESVEHAHNLLLEMGIELGFLAPLLLLSLTVVFILITFTRPIIHGKSDLRLLHIASFASLIGALVCGCTDYIFYNHRICFLFFLIAGLLVALARHQAEDYVRTADAEENTADTASTDIFLKK